MYRYPVSKPCLSGKEADYVNAAVSTGWISSGGQYVEKFEDAFKLWNNMKYARACSSGTTALTLAIRALEIGPGDEVIVPEFTMVASAWAVTYADATPVFVDCGDDLNIDVTKIEDAITARTKAIMPVHIYGRRCNMDAIMDIAKRYNLKVIEDSAEAHGVKPVGDIACFSLFANKIITSGEGGICLTNDPHLDFRLNKLRGMFFDADHTFQHPELAYNFRMSNLQAAVALGQVERLDYLLERRAEIEAWYDKYIPAEMQMPKRDVLWMYDIKVGDANGRHRDRVRKHLASHGVETRVFFKPMSMQFMYLDSEFSKLNAFKWSLQGLYLPTYVGLTEDDIKYICSLL